MSKVQLLKDKDKVDEELQPIVDDQNGKKGGKKKDDVETGTSSPSTLMEPVELHVMEEGTLPIPNPDMDPEDDEEILVVKAKYDARHNIKVMYGISFFVSMGSAIIMGPIFDKYVYILCDNSNKGVGIVESISGLMSLICALPVAWLVDNFKSRAFMARVSVPIGAVVVVMYGIVFLTDSLKILYATLVVMGIFYELQSSVSEAIFADSCPSGDRSAAFTKKMQFLYLGLTVGSLGTLACTVIFKFGDEWPLASIHLLLLVGGILFIPGLGMMGMLRDPDTQRLQSDVAGQVAEEPAPGQITRGNSSLSLGSLERRNAAGGAPNEGECADDNLNTPLNPTDVARSLAVGGTFAERYKNYVPGILATSNFCSCLGAGMTVKFFALFFTNELQFTAFQVSLLVMCYPISISFFAQVLQVLSKWIGRAQSSVLAFFLNACCFFLLYKVYHVPSLVVIYLIRGGLANANAAIDRSIMMDYTSASKRGLWNAVESFNSTTWSGSALLGGYLIDGTDYRYTFFISTLIYFCVCLIYSPLMWLVPVKEQQVTDVLRGNVPAGGTTEERTRIRSGSDGSINE